MVIKIEFTPLPDYNISPFFKGFLKMQVLTVADTMTVAGAICTITLEGV